MVRQIQSIVLLPGVMAVLVPGVILWSDRAWTGEWLAHFPVSLLMLILGLCLFGIGLTLVVNTVALFSIVGKGTLAPWSPPEKLVVRGIYQNVRNPMITGVMAVLLGEVAIMGAHVLFYWFIGFSLVNLVYIPLLEEPGLERRFGDDYKRYKRNVPRWIPRLKPWDDPADGSA